jgi:PAS domain S-box-containing protein
MGAFLLLSIPVVYFFRYIFNKSSKRRIREFEALKTRYQSLFNCCEEAVLLFSRNAGKVINGNLNFYRLTDLSRQDLLQANINSVLSAGETQESREALQRLLGGESIDTELLFLDKKDGARIPVRLTSTPIPDTSGDLDMIQVTMRDMSLNNSLQDKLTRREKMLEAFGIITESLNSGDDTLVRFKGLVKIIGEVMESDVTSIIFLDQGEYTAVGYQFDTEGDGEPQQINKELVDNSIYRWVASNKMPLLKEELAEEENYTEDKELFGQGIRSYLILPLVLREKVMGTLNLFNRDPGSIKKDDMEILSHIASHMTLGFNNIQLQKEAERKAQRLKQILVTSNSFRLQVFLDDLLKEIVWSIRFSTGFNFVVLSMLNNETKRVEVKALANNDKGVVKRLIGTTYSWDSFSTLMNDEQKISHSFLVDRKEPVLEKIKGLIAGDGDMVEKKESRRDGKALFVPIETRLGRIVGFLLVDDPQEMDENSIETIQTMEIFANEVAVVIDNQRLFEDAKKKSEELEELNKELHESKESLEDAKKMLETSNLELERANAELREVDKLKAEFLQNVTHELRTPLAPIMVNSEVLLLKKIGDLTPIQEEIIESIFQSTKRLNSLIDDLLDLTKMESGKMKYQFTHVNPESLVNNSLVETYPFSQEKNITINKHIQTGNMQIRGDSHRLIQLLTNLLRNSIKFTPDDGRIDLTLRARDGDKIELKISDTGVGIPASKLNKIFERFYQVDGSATRKYKGAGLGLAIVKKIVEAHQGQIDVESQEGKGTTFTIILPAGMGEVGEGQLVQSMV